MLLNPYRFLIADDITANRWRVLWQANFGGEPYCTCAELAFRGVDGSNLAVGGTAIALSEYNASQSASKAFDGNALTGWSSSGSSVSGQWLGYVFSHAVSIKEVALTMMATSTGGFRTQQMPKDMLIQYSNDSGVTWVSVGQYIGNPAWTMGETKAFAAVVPYRYWRVLWDAAYGSEAYASCGELSLRTIPGGAGMGFGAKAIASSEFSSEYNANKAFDGDVSTGWSSVSDGSNGPAGQWLGGIFIGSPDVVEVALTMKSTTTGGFRVEQMPKDFRVQWSDDFGVTWNTKRAITNTPAWTLGETKVFTL